MGAFCELGAGRNAPGGRRGLNQAFGDLRSSLFIRRMPAVRHPEKKTQQPATIAILLLLLCQGCPEHWRPHSFAPLVHQPAVVVPSRNRTPAGDEFSAISHDRGFINSTSIALHRTPLLQAAMACMKHLTTLQSQTTNTGWGYTLELLLSSQLGAIEVPSYVPGILTHHMSIVLY